MKSYRAEQIRNIALVGHHGSGKTTLAEAMLYCAGSIPRRGTVQEGNTVSDYHETEIERGMSVFSSLLHMGWNDKKLNVIDSPGFTDFAAEVISALKVGDVGCFVMDAAEGVQVGTEAAWHYAEETLLPCMFIINKLENQPHDAYRDLVKQITERFGRGATVVQIDGGPGTRSIIDVLLMKQLHFPEKLNGAFEAREIVDEFAEEAQALHQELIENIAENDEVLMEKFFEQGNLTEEEMREGLRKAMLNRQLFPVFVTSAELNIGVSRFMDFVCNVFPAPMELPPVELADGELLESNPDGPPVALVYRTIQEPHVGELSFLRMYSGTLRPGMDLENAQTGVMERIGQLYSLNGRDRDPLQDVVSGDIAVVVKLKNTHTNNTLRAKGDTHVIKPLEYPAPRYAVAITSTRQGDEEKLGQALNQLHEEDPSLLIVQDQHLGQTLLMGQGELHLNTAQARIQRRYGIEVEFNAPRISYRETITAQARASYRHKKQTGGAGQFADLSMLVEPLQGDFVPPADITVRNVERVDLPWGAQVEFIDAIVGGVIDMRRFFGAIQKGILEALQRGPVAGYPVGDLRVVIFDGGMHAVDSNENAFKTAARMGFREAFRNAKPVLLEPIHAVRITVPEPNVGDVMGDLNTRRGRIQGIEAEGYFQRIDALVPEVELYRYATTLRSLTQGRGIHAAKFDHYETMPRHVQEKVVAEMADQHEND